MNEKPHPAAIDFGGAWYLRDAKGALVPITAVKPADLLMDELTRSLMVRAEAESASVAAFKSDAFEAFGELQALLAQQYGAKLGGPKGNVTITTFDGCQRVQVRIADRIEFGPEMEAAKSLIDECLNEWAADGRPEIRALVNRVFQVDQQGKINRAEVIMLLRVEILDERWQRAMQAIRDSMRVAGSRAYLGFQRRDAGDAPWQAVSIDIAKV